MGYTVPPMPLTCNVWTHSSLPPNPPRIAGLACNLAMGKRISGSVTSTIVPQLLVPALSDIRDGFNASGQDYVEVPAGSGRFYVVNEVDDMGKGFPNEHRFAVLTKSLIPGGPGYSWPTPIP